MVFTAISMILVILKICGVGFITDWIVLIALAAAIPECFITVRKLKKSKDNLKKALNYADTFRTEMDRYRDIANRAIEAGTEAAQELEKLKEERDDQASTE